MQVLRPAANQTRVRKLAYEGAVAQGGRTFDAARQTGDNFLSAIAREAPGTLEGVVAQTVQSACAQRMYSESAYQGQNVALNALAAGVGGTIGPVLAEIGRNGMHKTIWHEASMAYHDGRSMGESYLDAIAARTEDATERALARAAREATNPRLLNQSAFQVQSEALRRVAGGIAGRDIPTTLAAFGRDARMKCLSNENARSVAAPLLEAIAQAGDARQQALARTAASASAEYLHQDAASLAQDVGFCKILEAPVGTLAQDLADLGTRSLKNCNHSEDQRNLGLGVLRGLARYAESPGVRQFAQVADNATCPRLYHFSAAGAHYDAFALIGTGETNPVKLMSEFGLKVLERGQTLEDSRTMAQGVLDALLVQVTDPVQKGVLESAASQARGAVNVNVAAGIQRFAFKWIVKAPELPVTGGASDSVDQAVLEQRIEMNTSVRSMLEDEISSLNGQMDQKQVRMGELADQFNPLVPIEHKLVRNLKLSRYAFFAGGACALAGVFVPGLQPYLMLGGGALVVGSLLAQGANNARRGQVLAQYNPLRQAYDRLDGEQQALQAGAQATRAMLGPVQAAIQADSSRLELVKLSQGVKPKTTTTIDVDRDMVTIGGVRINRVRPRSEKAAVPAPDGTLAPASSESGPVQRSS